MENVSHTLAGLALARCGLGRTTPLATTALVAGANLPDVDLLWSSFRSTLVYFHYHRGWTHALAGHAVLTIALWALLLAIDRLLPGREGAARARPAPLLLASALGVGSHVVMDAANSYGVRLLLPWSDRWFYGDLWVIVDPWLWLILGGTVFMTARGGRRRTLAWSMGATVAAIVVLSAPVVPPACRAAWAACLAIAAALCHHAARRGRPAGPRAAVAGLCLLLGYAGVCAVSHRSALARLRRLAPAAIGGAAASSGGGAEIAALPRPADPLRWEGLVIDTRSIRHRVIGMFPALDPKEGSWTVHPRHLDDPAARALWAGCAGGVVLEFFRFPIAAVETDADGGREIVVRDARYTRWGRGFAVFAAPLGADGLPAIDSGQCP